MKQDERQRSQESGVRSQNFGRESDPAGSLGKTASPLRRIATRSATGGQARRRVSIFGAGTTSCRNAFTLIEVLVSMAVLIVLILALTRMFVAAANITKQGTTALERNSAGETAMETLLQDTEGMAVNERLGCYVEADATDPGGFGFDEVWLITTSGDQDDGRAYQLMRYYVTNVVSTSSTGAEYMRYMLYRDLWIMAVAEDYGVDVFDSSQTDWWNYNLENIKTSSGWPIADRNMLADNVVRFDVYCLGWDGKDWMKESGGKRVFNSITGPVGLPQHVNKPPAAFDIYLQITSPKVAMESGMALLPGVDATTKANARAMMIRESSSLFGRASPVIGAAQYQHPVDHYSN